MALEEYRKKRDFSKSPEPAGDTSTKKSAREPLFFCVQKHLASHLHYDLRLEWKGVLMSWAVPKGASLRPGDKRLAMQVEDHPIEYGSFEGVIPEGYGAGIVMLWDVGTWEPETDDVDAALKKGDLKFRLNGFKLKGSWVLVRTRGYGGSGRSWLLIKHRDDWAGDLDITTFAPHSVKTPGADLADILAADNPNIWHSHAPAKGGDTGRCSGRLLRRRWRSKKVMQDRRSPRTRRTRRLRKRANPREAPRPGHEPRRARRPRRAQEKQPRRPGCPRRRSA